MPDRKPSIDPMIWENLRYAAGLVRDMSGGYETSLSMALHRAARTQDVAWLLADSIGAAIIKAYIAQKNYEEAVRDARVADQDVQCDGGTRPPK